MQNDPTSAAPVGGTLRWHSPKEPGEQSLAMHHTIDASGQAHVTGDGWEFALTAPKRLLPVTISKPWGEERWYTGMEARGESRVQGERGDLPLSAYLALAPDQIGAGLPVVLLKLLVSRAETRLGELYCEVHREKAEAYLVTGVDEQAWPAGEAWLRYGIDPRERAASASDDALRARLYASATALEAAPNDPERLAAFEQLIGRVPLRRGSCFQIARGVPHGLPHGVRVIEFQTPTYERLILAASQPVVTQDHWDVAAATAALRLEAPDPTPPPDPSLPPGQLRLARFSDFGARVLHFNSQTQGHRLPPTRGAVVVCCTAGQVSVGDLLLGPEEAVIVPQAAILEGMELTTEHEDGGGAVVAAADY